ncbi:pseudouridine-5'-phosphate glycosidase [Candidatus Protofrankia californiensis]|uniref:pseudouridine-5'-phosphate glycosidase n=1 Tax=Candidatus Protofrankia californiensis TaxID=1839754 RepID=UPI001041961C|nr:pseudouridine-5'-phosphate glycosidase [Candidatus Protofrankia californiensis]
MHYCLGVGGLVVADEVRAALDAGRPVVALESTLIAHGLPRPRNLEVAAELETLLRDRGVAPATIAVIDGIPTVGLDAIVLTRIADSPDVAKLSVRDLPVASALRRTGATTVASTSLLAARAGIRVFATGGLGGVHRGWADSADESADLVTLASTPITVICAGVKSILDVGATLERLETLGVTLLGWRTNTFPGFYLSRTEFTVDWRVEAAADVAAVMADAQALGLRAAVVVANPVPEAEQLDQDLHDRVLTEALAEAARRGLRGKAVTPFLLATFHRETAGASLETNIAVVRNNVIVAADIATAWSARLTGPDQA